MAVLHGHLWCIFSTLPDQLEARKSDTTFPRNPWWLHRSSGVRTTSVDESRLILSCLHHYHLAVTWTRRVVYCYVSLSELSTGQIRPTPPYLLEAPGDFHPHQSFLNIKYKISDQLIMARLPISMLRIGLSLLHMCRFDYLFYFISDDIPFIIFHIPSSHTATVSVIMIIEGISSFWLTSIND